jgi:membrane-bound ClpP family serine protease
MWLVAEFLLGFVVLATLAGFHVGPHSHLAAGVMGVIAAIWLLIMAATGQAAPLLWIVLGADVAVSGAVGTMALHGIQTSRLSTHALPGGRIVGAEGIAETDLSPEGIVKVRSESWSATSLNGLIPKGTKVQVIESSGVRLGVWGEDPELNGVGLEHVAEEEQLQPDDAGGSPDEPTTGAS